MYHSTSYALVLGGGGSKGAYQIGAMQALQEFRLPVSAVIGTSVGALNAAFWATGQVKTADQVWRSLTLDQVIRIPAGLMKDGRLNLDSRDSHAYKEFRHSIFRSGGADTGPLRSLIQSLLDEDKVRRSGLDFGIVSFELGGMRPLEYFLEHIPAGTLTDYLMASSAFPGFKIQKLDQKVVMDGGLADNVPYNLARRRGYRNIIVVDVSGLGVKQRPNVEQCRTIYIRNSADLGGIMDFDPEQSARNIRMGYLDTLRTMDRVAGLEYYYYPDARLARQIEQLLLDPRSQAQYQRYLPDTLAGSTLTLSTLSSILPERWRINREPVYAFLECAALCLGVEKLELYRLSGFIKELKQRKKDLEQRQPTLRIRPGFVERMVSIFETTPDLLSLGPLEYARLMDYLLGSREGSPLHSRALGMFSPELMAARVLLEVLDGVRV